MTKILVTGSNGFIGKNLVKKLSKYEIISDTNNFKQINLNDEKLVMNLEVADLVIHLAGKIPQENFEQKKFFENNILITQNILKYCIKNKVKKIIYVSSYVYGEPKYLPIDENHSINPHSIYSKSKYEGEKLCKFYSDNFDLNVTILRPFNIFGESMKPGFFISNLINSVRTGKKLTIINKNSKRDFLHIDDFVDLIIKIKDHDYKFEIFNIGTGISYSFLEIIKKVEKISLKKLDIDFKEDDTFIDDIKADITKIINQMNWQPKIKLDEGLKKMLEEKER
jgi:UDP-glucose 4-epimerase